MTEEANEQQEVKTYTQAEVDEMIGGLKKSRDEILSEKKAEAAKRAEIEAAKKQVEENALKEKGEFETLYGQTNEELTNLRAQVAADKEAQKQNTIKNYAAKLATDIAGGLGGTAVEDVTRILSESVQINDDGQPVYTIGGVQVDSETMIKQFRESRPYLVAGSQASGGGASQTQSTGGAGYSGKDYSKMSPEQQVAYLEANPPKRN